jgi:hypothetical protein
VSAVTPLAAYDAALLALDEAVEGAELTLNQLDELDPNAALETCVTIARVFETAERGLRALRERGERGGLALYRAMMRANTRVRE